MSTIKSSDEHLTLNADGSSKDIKFQANGVEKASISSAGAFTSTTIDATALTGTIPNFTSTGIDDNADALAMTIDSSERIGIGTGSPLAKLDVSGNNGSGGYVGVIRNDTNSSNYHGLLVSTMYDTVNSTVLHLKTNTANPTTGGTDLFKVTGNGHVTMPLQPAFDAYHFGGAYSSGTTVAALDLDTTRLNVGGHYNTSNYRFTAPVAGVYKFNYRTILNGTASNAHVRMLKNGSTMSGSDSHYSAVAGTAWSTWATQAIVLLAANDYVEVKHNPSVSIHGDDYQSFNGYLIG